MNIGLKTKNIIKKIVLFSIEELSGLLGNDKNKPLDQSGIKKILASGGGGGIGDLLRALPAVESLHANFPEASISLLASPESRDIVPLTSASETISEIINYDPKNAHRSFFKKLGLLTKLRKFHFDLVYFPSRGEAMREEVLMNLIIGAPHRLGFKKGNVGLLNTIKIELRDDQPILDQNLAILKAANLNIYKENVRLEVSEHDLQYAKKFLNEHNFNNTFPLISIHTGASWYTNFRCWPNENYIYLIRYLVKTLNAKIIIIGSKSEIEVGKVISDQIHDPSFINMIGETTVGQMAAIIKLSHLFIGNDSGPLHIALALGVPSVAIFGPTSPEQVIAHTDNFIAVNKKVNCSPCYLHQPGFKPHCHNRRCLEEITADEVIKPTEKLLDKIKETVLL